MTQPNLNAAGRLCTTDMSFGPAGPLPSVASSLAEPHFPDSAQCLACAYRKCQGGRLAGFAYKLPLSLSIIGKSRDL